jgi:hypothetical protein
MHLLVSDATQVFGFRLIPPQIKASMAITYCLCSSLNIKKRQESHSNLI